MIHYGDITNKGKTISEQIEEIIEEICDNYCKYPSEYLAEYKDPDDANTAMLEEVCRNCPLERL